MSIENKRAALYGRISTLIHGQDVEAQLLPVREYAKSRGFQVVEEFIDKGISGARERRPALDKMLQMVRTRKVDLIICAGLDRISRNTKHCLGLIDELNHFGVALISLRESFDMTSPSGRLVVSILASVAELERALISERIRSALASKKAIAERDGTGWRCGRPVVATADMTKRISDLRARGVSIRKIAKEVGVSTATVQRAIKASK